MAALPGSLSLSLSRVRLDKPRKLDGAVLRFLRNAAGLAGYVAYVSYYSSGTRITLVEAHSSTINNHAVVVFFPGACAAGCGAGEKLYRVEVVGRG
jgi:hypothetical protein